MYLTTEKYRKRGFSNTFQKYIKIMIYTAKRLKIQIVWKNWGLPLYNPFQTVIQNCYTQRKLLRNRQTCIWNWKCAFFAWDLFFKTVIQNCYQLKIIEKLVLGNIFPKYMKNGTEYTFSTVIQNCYTQPNLLWIVKLAFGIEIYIFFMEYRS